MGEEVNPGLDWVRPPAPRPLSCPGWSRLTRAGTLNGESQAEGVAGVGGARGRRRGCFDEVGAGHA
jgi:hypothetical protein